MSKGRWSVKPLVTKELGVSSESGGVGGGGGWFRGCVLMATFLAGFHHPFS